MRYLEIINTIGPIATAGALIWSLIQHRIDNKQLKIQMEYEKEKYNQERKEFEKLQIDSEIRKLDLRFEQYTEIFLITEKLQWAFAKMKNEVSKESEFDIKKFEPHFEIISSMLNELEPWQQAIIGDLPIDPLINKFYSYYEYTSSEDLLSWIEHFETQTKEAAEVANDMTDKFSEQIRALRDKSIRL